MKNLLQIINKFNILFILFTNTIINIVYKN